MSTFGHHLASRDRQRPAQGASRRRRPGRLLPIGVALAGLLVVVAVHAQPAGSMRQVNLIGEDRQLALRLRAADRLVDPLGMPEMVAKNLASLAGADGFASFRAATA